MGVHTDFEALEDVGAYDSVGSVGEAASGDLDETFIEGQVSEGHGAGQGDSGFSVSGIAEAGQTGGDDGFQGEIAGRAGIQEDTSGSGVEEEAEGFAGVDPGGDEDAVLRGTDGTESGEGQTVGHVGAGQARGEAAFEPLVNLALGDGVSRPIGLFEVRQARDIL